MTLEQLKAEIEAGKALAAQRIDAEFGAGTYASFAAWSASPQNWENLRRSQAAVRRLRKSEAA